MQAVGRLFEKLEYELFYIQNQSIFLDLFILLKTVQTVLFGRPDLRVIMWRKASDCEVPYCRFGLH